MNIRRFTFFCLLLFLQAVLGYDTLLREYSVQPAAQITSPSITTVSPFSFKASTSCGTCYMGNVVNDPMFFLHWVRNN